MSKINDNTEVEINQQLEKYRFKKQRNLLLLAFIVKHVTRKMQGRIHTCGDWLAFTANVTLEKWKLWKANFCKWRFCPMCAWRQARKDALKIAVLIKYVQQEHKKEFLFLTLTTPNVTADKLNEEITRYNKNFEKLMKRKEIKKVVKGYVRKLEITYNSEEFITQDMWKGNKEKHIKSHRDHFERRGLKIGDRNPSYNTYHPHFHVLIAVNKSYFEGRDYIKQHRWLELWQDVTKDKTITKVTIQQVRANEGKEVQEMAKYSAKDSGFLHSQDVFDTFYEALKGRQVITYSGLFAEAHKLFKDDKLNQFKEQDNTEYMYWLLYRWGKGQYVQAELRELDEQERREVNKQLIDEMEVEMDNDTEQ